MSTSGRPQSTESRRTPAVRWRVVEVDMDGQRARLAPYVALGALTRLLDEAHGVDGWANRYRSFGQDAVGCELEANGVVKSVITRGVPKHVDPTELAAAGLTVAAHMHGLRLPVDPDVDVWVEYDPEERRPLYWPEPTEALVVPDMDLVGRGLAPRDERLAEHRHVVESTEASDPTSSTLALTAKPLGTPPDRSGQAPIKSEGQRAIDKLVDRLREAGYGLEAAKLVMAHKGYGTDPDAARELYAQLRQLLLDGAGR